jgi:hypothetical protein
MYFKLEFSKLESVFHEESESAILIYFESIFDRKITLKNKKILPGITIEI